jgi:hypothetical protein
MRRRGAIVLGAPISDSDDRDAARALQDFSSYCDLLHAALASKNATRVENLFAAAIAALKDIFCSRHPPPLPHSPLLTDICAVLSPLRDDCVACVAEIVALLSRLEPFAREMIENRTIELVYRNFRERPIERIAFLSTLSVFLQNYGPAAELLHELGLFAFLTEFITPQVPCHVVICALSCYTSLFRRGPDDLVVRMMTPPMAWSAQFTKFESETDQFEFQRAVLAFWSAFARNLVFINIFILNRFHKALMKWITNISPCLLPSALGLLLRLLEVRRPEFQQSIMKQLRGTFLVTVLFGEQSTEKVRILGCQIMMRLFHIDQDWANSAFRIGVADLLRDSLADGTFALREAALECLARAITLSSASEWRWHFLRPALVEHFIEMAEVITDPDKLACIKAALVRIAREFHPEDTEVHKLLIPLFDDGLLSDADVPLTLLMSDS